MKQCVLIIILFLSSCGGKCDDLPTACFDIVPENESCDAFYERWFYNKAIGRCEKIVYTGCEPYGFSSEGECLACQCNND